MTTSRADILKFLSIVIDSSTIVVGHSLSSDFDVLGIVHTRVIDTSALYPHQSGLPYKRSLKDLAKDYLGRDIQLGDQGHNPIADALAALELAFLFIMAPRDDLSKFLPPLWSSDKLPPFCDRYTLFHHIQRALQSSNNETIRVVNHDYKRCEANMLDELEGSFEMAYDVFMNDKNVSSTDKEKLKV